MHWIKKAVLGMLTGLFIFITISILAGASLNPFSGEFVSIGGLMLLLGMGAVELNFITYS